MTNRNIIRLFWIKLVILIVTMGGIIGFLGYKHAKTPAFITLAQMATNNEQVAERVALVEHQIGDIEQRLSVLEGQHQRKKIVIDGSKND